MAMDQKVVIRGIFKNKKTHMSYGCRLEVSLVYSGKAEVLFRLSVRYADLMVSLVH